MIVYVYIFLLCFLGTCLPQQFGMHSCDGALCESYTPVGDNKDCSIFPGCRVKSCNKLYMHVKNGTGVLSSSSLKVASNLFSHHFSS